MRDAYWVADKEARCIIARDELLAFLGCKFADIAGHAWVDRVHPDDIERVCRITHRCIASHCTLRLVFRLRRWDGTWREVASLGMPLYQRGEFLGLHGFVSELAPWGN